jgi:hypothetical protein
MLATKAFAQIADFDFYIVHHITAQRQSRLS